ncbi:MAG: tetratricopeptide repeat protein [candidate division Zixibacteria bacterium]|nr:tetratricopeptide repeat protein [candidate division Zixibacteria bacterium]
MNICKSCGITIHEEGKVFCPACEASAREGREVGLAGEGPEAEKGELTLEGDTQRVSVVKLSEPGGKTGPEKSEEDTDKVGTTPEEPEANPNKAEANPDNETAPAAPQPAPADEEPLAFSESPLSEGFAVPETAKEEPETLSAAIEKGGSTGSSPHEESGGGPKSYLSAEERRALLLELDAARKTTSGGAVRESAASTLSPKIERKRNDLPMSARGGRSAPPSGGESVPNDRPSPTSVARGIAYFSGTHIHLVGGAHLASGEELTFKDRIYVLREKPGSAGGGRWVYVLPMVMLLLAGALLWVVSRPSPGGIAGLALDSRTRSTFPGARVRLLERGESAIANEAGFFVMPELPPGSYNLLAEGAGLEGRAQVEVTKGGIAPIIITLQPTQEEILSQIPVVEPKPALPSQPETPPAPEPRLAGLTLSVEPADAEAYLDGQSLGSGGIFKDLPAGRHTLSVKRERYQDWQNPVELKPGQMNRVRVALVPEKTVPTVSEQPVRKGFEDYLKEGENYLAKNDYSRAVTALSEAVKIRPGSAAAHTLLGEAYWGKQEVRSGNTYFTKAARIYAQQGSYPKAEELYLKVLEADPNQGGALMELGNLYVAMGNTKAARETFQEHTKKFGGSLDGFFALGKLEYQERQFKDAARAFEKALGSSSKPAMIHGYLVLSYIQSNNKRKAQAAYDSFMKLATPSELSTLKNHRDWSRVLAELSVRE